MAKERPAPVRPAPAESPVAPGGAACPACGTANEAGRRFCRRCGAILPGAATSERPRIVARPSWWRRLLGRSAQGDSDTDRSLHARSAYRRTLDVRYRVLRWVGVVAVLGLGAGFLGVTGLDPRSGARDLWRRFFPRDELVTEVTASVDPVEAERREYTAAAAVDGAPDTAWAAGWQLTPADPPVPGCAPDPGTGGADATLTLLLPESGDLSKIAVQPGLPQGDADRENQWRPTVLELRFDDGTCLRVELSDEAGTQTRRIEAKDTGSVRITVLDAAAPLSGAGDLVSIGEVRLYRPG